MRGEKAVEERREGGKKWGNERGRKGLLLEERKREMEQSRWKKRIERGQFNRLLDSWLDLGFKLRQGLRTCLGMHSLAVG